MLPRVRFLVREKKGIHCMQGAISTYNKEIKYGRIVEPDKAFSKLSEAWNELPFVYSKNGKRLAVSDNAKRVAVYDAITGKEICVFGGIRGRAISLSPNGTYLVVWTKYDKSVGPNLIVYDVDAKRECARLFQKNYSQRGWPSLRWTDDETVAATLEENSVIFFCGHPFAGKKTSSLHVKRVSEFILSPTTKPLKIATFSPQTKGGAANVSVHLYPSSAALKGAKPLNSRAFFKAEEGDLSFSPSGNHVLCTTATELDRSGGSYYGHIAGYLLSCGIGIVPSSATLPEVCHTAAWSPNRDEYVAVTGTLPGVVALYDGKGDVLKHFGKCGRNTVCWSPHGRFFCVAGFGNLAGHMDFYDRVTLEKLGQATATSPPTSWSWSPDSRTFLTVTQFPRMRQSVGYELYTYRGDIIFRQDVNELMQASWCPAPLTDVPYPNRPPSPTRSRAKDVSVRDLAKKAKRLAGSKKYRPPNSTGRISSMMRGGGVTSTKKAYSAKKEYVPPGGSTADFSSAKGNAKTRNRRRRGKKSAAESGDGAAKVASTPPAAPKELTPEMKAKEIKKIKKKLRQIKELKEKDKATLKPGQIEKLSHEGDLERRLSALGL